MPVWLVIVINVITVLVAVAGAFGITTYAQTRQKHKAEKKNKQEDEQEAALNELEQVKKENAIRAIFKEEMQPVKDELSEIKEQLVENTKATVTGLRCDMKDLRDRYTDKGYATTSEKSAFQDLYDDYKGLGGNHFKNYVDGWKGDVDVLPNEKPVTKRKSSKKA